MDDSTKARCEYVSPRGHIHCQLDTDHPGRHRAWDEVGIPTLVMHAAEGAN